MVTDTGIPPNRNITTLSVLVIEKLLGMILSEFSNIKVVYDENLSYESAVSKLRADNLQNGTNFIVDQFPVFAFNRSVMRYSTEGVGRRSVVATTFRRLNTINQPNTAQTYHCPHLEFDLNFLYFTKSTQKIEEFEILYLSEDGISQNKIITLDLTPDLGGSMQYFIDYKGKLDSKVLQLEKNYWKQVNGSIVVRGYFPVIQGQSAIITEIQKQIYNYQRTVLWEHEIVT
jgi:hypothetical protein